LIDHLEEFRRRYSRIQHHLPPDFDLYRFDQVYSRVYLEMFRTILTRELWEWRRDYRAGNATREYSASRVLMVAHRVAQDCASELAGVGTVGATDANWRNPPINGHALPRNQALVFESLENGLRSLCESLFGQAVRAFAPEEWVPEWASRKPPSP